jgi:hypothetical protein
MLQLSANERETFDTSSLPCMDELTIYSGSGLMHMAITGPKNSLVTDTIFSTYWSAAACSPWRCR